MNWNGLTDDSFWYDRHRVIFNKDCRSMADLPNEYVQMCGTSPPYWGLRKYAGLPDLIWDGDVNCNHSWNETIRTGEIYDTKTGGAGSAVRQAGKVSKVAIPNAFCSFCGAWKGQLGLEPTPEMYIDHLVEIFREVRRVLRKDGVVFLNIGDSYLAQQGKGFPGTGQVNLPYQDRNPPIKRPEGMKPKDLCLIPFRLAIALQTDGWWVRSVIIWNKPNPMPESVTDRPTESHEYILMLTKSARYYWDAEAVREPNLPQSIERAKHPFKGIRPAWISSSSPQGTNGKWDLRLNPTGRNLRSVWTFPTQPYPEAHFATYPEKLVEICVKAATPEVGCCSQCGKPWVRIVKFLRTPDTPRKKDAENADRNTKGERWLTETQTLGWQPQCKCEADKVPSIVLDPFAGSGTTLKVAAGLNRRAIGYELSQAYCDLAIERSRQAVMI